MKRKCPTCGGSSTKTLYRQAFSRISDDFPIKDYDVVVCRECGFGYADNVPEQKQLDTYYKDLSKYENMHQAGKCSDDALANYQKIVDGLKPFLSGKEVRIADIGCATGGLLSVLRKNGYTSLAGIDPSASCAKSARDTYGIPVLTSSLFDVQPPDKPYDVLVFSSVMEHVIDLSGALMRMRELLVAGGLMFIEVPDTVNFTTWISAPFQQFSVEHVNFFSPTSLSNLMRRHGFEAVAIWHDVRAMGVIKDPSLTSIFRKVDIMDAAPAHDYETEIALERYIEQSRADDAAVSRRIDMLVDSGLPILVWGTGTQAQRLLATTRLGSAQIRAFVDSNPNYQGKRLNGFPILAPTKLHNYPEVIVVTSQVFQEEIAYQICNVLHLRNDVIRLFDKPGTDTAPSSTSVAP